MTSSIEVTESRTKNLVNDGQLRARNQRMFGLLKGTLIRFQEETSAKETTLKVSFIIFIFFLALSLFH